MTAQEYLEGLLAKQKLSDGQKKYLKKVRQKIERVIRDEYNEYPIIYYGGSYKKHTMIRESFDLDIVIYFPHTEQCSLKEIYYSVHKTLLNAKYKVKRKTVALNIQMRKSGFHVDVVPGKAKDETYEYANLYKNDEGSRKLTSLKKHIEIVQNSKCRPIIKLMKLWKIRNNLQDWRGFHLEMTVINALKKYRKKTHYDASLLKVFNFIQQAEIDDLHVVDPANCNNIIEIPESTYNGLKKAAAKSLNAKYWKDVIW